MSCVQARDKHSVTAPEVTQDETSPHSGVPDVMSIQSNNQEKYLAPLSCLVSQAGDTQMTWGGWAADRDMMQ